MLFSPFVEVVRQMVIATRPRLNTGYPDATLTRVAFFIAMVAITMTISTLIAVTMDPSLTNDLGFSLAAAAGMH